MSHSTQTSSRRDPPRRRTAPWCAVCQRLKPAYVAAAAVLADEDPPIALFEVDASAEETLAKK